MDLYLFVEGNVAVYDRLALYKLVTKLTTQKW